MTKSILFVFTSVGTSLLGNPTGWWLAEAAHPYKVLSPKYSIDFASPAGPNPPVDEFSVKTSQDSNDSDSLQFLENPTVKEKLATAKKLSDVNEKDYDAIFYIGGHGPVIDLATDSVNIKLADEFYAAGKITAAVCHGTAALVGVTDNAGNSIFKGKKVTGFSNAEEEIVGKVKDIPFLLEDKVTSLGGKYEKATAPWSPHVVVDGKLITGQNPASATSVGEAIDKALST